MPAPLVTRLARQARTLAASGLYYSESLRIWTRLALNDKAVVLTYHRVLSEDDAARTWSRPGIVVTRDTFEQHLRLLSQYFRVLSLEAFLERLDAARGFDEPSCLITF